ncbi:tetratricopeptide repeat protein [Schlesneria sp.]|uniref:tetratricopeptide repeat protein n=1 Tax=Schlesneria sp. TaxID=2762018 RepID=UPI002F150632
MRSLNSLCLILLLLLLPGCGPRVVKAPFSGVDSSGNGKKDGASTASSDDVLTSAVHQLRPENFGINAATDKPVSLLNSWRYKRAEKEPAAEQSVPVTTPSGWVQPEEEERLNQAKFDAIDAQHVRDAMFHRVLAGYLSDRGQSELQKVVAIVEFVCRNVALWKDDDIELQMQPYLVMQLGLGSAEDRAWVCAEIFRQMRIDTIVLRASSDTRSTSDKWLLGVILDGKVYLFDLQLGLPIGRGEDTARDSVATLAEILEHPDWLQQMAIKDPYRLTADELRDATVYVMTGMEFWCRRMHDLEQVLPPSDLCILYDPLSDEAGRTGLLQRVAKAGNWSVDSLKLWPYPRQQAEEMKKIAEEKQLEWNRLTVPFSVPIPVDFHEDGKFTIGTPERKFQRYRSDHLLGKFAEATARYLRIRHLEVERNPPDVEVVNKMASENAFYWTALCKYELGEYATAVELLTDYIKKYDRKGKWFFPARTLLAQSHAELGQYADAIATFDRTSSDDPYRVANALRVKRWTEAKSK